MVRLMDYALLLRDLREHAGLTQAALAKRARVNPRTLRRYEQGEREPTVSVAARLRQACEAAMQRKVVRP
jgi:transcriptional regulator with XRE-family HTH domain